MAKRIDTLKSGEKVTLGFYYQGQRTLETAEFVKVEGDGEKRRATFISETEINGERRKYNWQAYRYHGRWSYGTGADRLTLVKVGE